MSLLGVISLCFILCILLFTRARCWACFLSEQYTNGYRRFKAATGKHFETAILLNSL
jgi:hypothetical protein